jgi:hypothetical protein
MVTCRVRGDKMGFSTVEQEREYARKYYADNRARILERAKQRYAESPEIRETKSAYRKQWWQSVSADWNRYKIYMVRRAKHRAKKLNLPFNITTDDIHIPERCPIFGTILQVAVGRHKDASPALDRIVPEKGYVKGNVIVISHRANVLKRDASLEELEKLVDGLRRITN